jgi:serine/threonine-protein kinase
VIGTAQYLSPEQARGETVDPRSDLYSAGCLLFELVTGRPPFVADSPVAVAYQHVREAPPLPSSLNPAISEDLDRVILHSLAKDRETRYQSAAEFRADLDNLRQGRAPLAPAAVLHDAAAPAGVDRAQAPTRALTYPTLPTPQQATTPPGHGYPAGVPTAMDYPDYAGPDRRQGLERERGRRAGRSMGYVLLGLVAVAVFAAVAYLAYTLLGSGGKQVAVPRVTGLNKAVATSTLENLGLIVKTTTKASDTVPVDVVITQDPQQGLRVDQGSTVALTVSTGSATTQVPDVKNFTQEQARAAIADAGLVVGSTETVDAADVDKGRAVSTVPKATSSVAKGTSVKLQLSSGQVEVPDVTNKSFTEASSILAKLRISVVRETEPSDQPEGTVLSQDLSAGTKVDAGKTSITLRVAVPVATAPSPVDSSSPPPGPSEPGPSPSPTP